MFVFDTKKQRQDALCRGENDGLGIDNHARLAVRCMRDNMPTLEESVVAQIYDDTLQILLGWIERYTTNLKIIAVGHRVVHGGTFFSHRWHCQCRRHARDTQLEMGG